jgi:hypothetical protein
MEKRMLTMLTITEKMSKFVPQEALDELYQETQEVVDSSSDQASVPSGGAVNDDEASMTMADEEEELVEEGGDDQEMGADIEREGEEEVTSFVGPVSVGAYTVTVDFEDEAPQESEVDSADSTEVQAEEKEEVKEDDEEDEVDSGDIPDEQEEEVEKESDGEEEDDLYDTGSYYEDEVEEKDESVLTHSNKDDKEDEQALEDGSIAPGTPGDAHQDSGTTPLGSDPIGVVASAADGSAAGGASE